MVIAKKAAQEQVLKASRAKKWLMFVYSVCNKTENNVKKMSSAALDKPLYHVKRRMCRYLYISQGNALNL